MKIPTFNPRDAQHKMDFWGWLFRGYTVTRGNLSITNRVFLPRLLIAIALGAFTLLNLSLGFQWAHSFYFFVPLLKMDRKKNSSDRRSFLKTAATMGGGTIMGAALLRMGQNVLAGPSSTQVAVYNKYTTVYTYDYLVFSDGTNYYAKSGYTGAELITNTTPDVWALLQSIDTAAASTSITTIAFTSNQFTGSTTFSPGVGKGYRLGGLVSPHIQYQGLSITASGTQLKYTGAGKMIDCSTNYATNFQNPTQILDLRDLIFQADSSTTNWLDYTNANGSILDRVKLYSTNNNSSSNPPKVGSVGVFFGSVSNIGPMVIRDMEAFDIDRFLYINCDFVWLNGFDSQVPSSTKAAIDIEGGETHSFSNINFARTGGTATLGGEIYDNRPANTMEDGNLGILTIFHLGGETSTPPYYNKNGAYYYIIGFMYTGGAPYMDVSTNVPIIAWSAINQNYTSASATPVTAGGSASTGFGITLFATFSKSPLNPDHLKTYTSAFRVRGAVQLQNNTVLDGTTVNIYRSTTAIPAKGAAPGGGDTIVWTGTATEFAVGGFTLGLAFDFVDSGLSIATQYYYYMTIQAVTGGTAAVLGGTNQTSIYAEAV